jgi:hypothetical protein
MMQSSMKMQFTLTYASHASQATSVLFPAHHVISRSHIAANIYIMSKWLNKGTNEIALQSSRTVHVTLFLLSVGQSAGRCLHS